MASLVLGAIGGYFGGPVGAAVGSYIGGLIDQKLFGPDAIAIEGPRQTDLSVQNAVPGAPIARLFGRARLAGSLVWSTGLIETRHEEEQGGGKGGGGGGGANTITYTYSTSLAVLLCRGPISSVGRIWGDSKLLRNAAGEAPRVTNGIRVYTGTQTQLPDSLLEASNGGTAPAHRGHAYVVIDNLELADFGSRVPNLTFEVFERTSKVTTGIILTSVLEDSGLVDGVDFDIACLPEEDIIGYAMARPITARKVVEQISQIQPIDAANTGFKLLFRTRNRKIDSIVHKEDLAASIDDTRPARRKRTRAQDLEMPREINLTYMDPNRDYQSNEARSTRIRIDSENVSMLEIPMVMEPYQAKEAVENIATRTHVERYGEEWFLPFKYSHVDAGDILAIARTDRTLERFRVVKTTLGVNGLIRMSVVPDQFEWMKMRSRATVVSVVPQTVSPVADTIAYLANLPNLLDSDAVDTPGFYFSFSTHDLSEWGGAQLFGSSDNSTFVAIDSAQGAATAGWADTVLGDGPTAYIDRSNGVTVTIYQGALATITYDQMFGIRNIALIGDEIVRFQTATLLGTVGSQTTYLLTNLKRGIRGTERFTGTHVAGERFLVFKASSSGQVAHSEAQIGALRYWRAVTFRQKFQDVGSPDQEGSFTSTAENLRPWSGINPAVVRDADDITLTWVRRARRVNGWLNNHGVELAEATESYEIDVMSDATASATVLRTLTAVTPSVAYTAAQQTTDFGSAQDPVTFKIYQRSAIVGRGNVLTATL